MKGWYLLSLQKKIHNEVKSGESLSLQILTQCPPHDCLQINFIVQ